MVYISFAMSNFDIDLLFKVRQMVADDKSIEDLGEYELLYLQEVTHNPSRPDVLRDEIKRLTYNLAGMFRRDKPDIHERVRKNATQNLQYKDCPHNDPVLRECGVMPPHSSL